MPTAAIQLIVFGDRNRTDIAGVMRDIAASGFPALEAGNLFEAHGEEIIRRLLEENRLRVSGAHFGYGEFTDPDKLRKHIDYAKALGVRDLCCSGVAAGTVDGYRESAALFNRIGATASNEGLTFHYHNHAFEFESLDGRNGMDILAAETDPTLVKFNMDVFWLYFGGEDPAAFIRKHANRAGYYHFKDGRKVRDSAGKTRPEFLELGRGDVDLRSAMQAARDTRAEWIVAEQDSTALPHLESATISREYMRDALGV